jgi:predicted dehydrogenase
MAELTDFANAVRDGRAPTVTGEDGLETLRLAMEFVRSGRDAELVLNDDVLSAAPTLS